MAWTIEYFETEGGQVPAADFEDSLPVKLAAKLARFLKEAAESEGKIGGGIFEKCHSQPGLWEVRAKLGDDLAREFCTRDGDRLVVLSGIVKPNRTPTPDEAFHQAMGYLCEYKATGKVAK